MNIIRLLARLVFMVGLAPISVWDGAAAQSSGFTCEDFLTQTAAQHTLERDPLDPYGLDPDGDGIACEDMLTNGNTEVRGAPDVDAVEEPLDADTDGADVVAAPPVPSQSPQGGITTEERGPLDAITGILLPVGGALRRVGDLVHIPQLVAARGVADVAHQWVRWQASLDEAIALDLPPAFADVHRRSGDAVNRLVDASHAITGGLDRGDEALAKEAAATIGHVNAVIDQAQALIDALATKRGG